MRIILASASPRRKELLEMIGLKPEIIKSGADETTDEEDPEKLVEELSRRKAENVAENIDNGLVIGADTIVYVDGFLLGKPDDEEEAGVMLGMLSGKFHYVSSGVTLILKKNGERVETETFSETTKVYVDTLDMEDIFEYIYSGEPMDKAGAYAIQGTFGKYISRIEGDYYTVVGLPLAKTYAAIKRMEKLAGKDIPDNI